MSSEDTIRRRIGGGRVAWRGMPVLAATLLAAFPFHANAQLLPGFVQAASVGAHSIVARRP